MFEEWPVEMTPPTRRVVEPPIPVLVDLTRILKNPDDRFGRNEVSMRVKAEGLDFCLQVSGYLRAWAQSTQGGWLALVTCDVPTGNGKGKLPITQWCPANSVTPAD